jgi:hypothetical protein
MVRPRAILFLGAMEWTLPVRHAGVLLVVCSKERGLQSAGMLLGEATS